MLNLRALFTLLIIFLVLVVLFVVMRLVFCLSMAETFTGMFAFSGWAAVIYSLISEKSTIRANLLSVIPGEISFPSHPSMSSFVAYMYLVNPGKNPVHLLDCEMDVKIKGKGWKPLQRVYGRSSPVPIAFGNGEVITIPDGCSRQPEIRSII